MDGTITLTLPEALYHRLANAARATSRPLEEILLHALRLGSPPEWEDAPAELQADLAAMDRLDDEALWRIARGRLGGDMTRYDELLDRDGTNLSEAEQVELARLRTTVEHFTLRKAHAAVLLRWRGHEVPLR